MMKAYLQKHVSDYSISLSVSTNIFASCSKTFLAGAITWKDHFAISTLVSEVVAEIFTILLFLICLFNN